jgi:hypothetical protein
MGPRKGTVPWWRPEATFIHDRMRACQIGCAEEHVQLAWTLQVHSQRAGRGYEFKRGISLPAAILF